MDYETSLQKLFLYKKNIIEHYWFNLNTSGYTNKCDFKGRIKWKELLKETTAC